MRVAGVDIETTGLDPEKDQITEIGWAIMDVPLGGKPLKVESHLCLIDGPVPDEITKLTSITTSMLVEFGIPLGLALRELEMAIKSHKVDYVVAHNGNRFDRPFLEKAGLEVSIPWLDTMEIDYGTRHRNLTYLAAVHGFVNPYPHAALFDVMATLKVLSFQDLDKFIAGSKLPWVVIRAMVSYDDRDMAKARGFSWQDIDGKIYQKCWVKKVKADEVATEKKDATFTVVTVEEL